jgi:hypothetical protein
VPYVGAVTTVDLGAQGLRAGYVRFNTSVVSVPEEQGIMFWDADDETIDVILNGYIMKIGEDQFYPVKNQTGSSIAKGTAVRFAGTVGASGRLLIAPFIADGSVSSSFFMGVTAEVIADGEDGKVLYFGRIRGINTDAFNEGDVLYASTTVAGGFQTAVPVAPNNIVQVAAVINKSINQGVIFIRPSFGSNINQDEGVKIVSPTTGQLLQLQANGLWENKTTAQVLGGTSSQFVKGDGTLDSTAYGTGTVTSVAALTLGTSGTDLSSTVANGTTTPVITLNVPTASATNRGALSSSDWTTFNNKTSNLGTVTSVGLSSATSGVTIGSTPITTSGTITLEIATASGSQNGLLSSSDWTTFNGKQNALTNPVTGTGTTNYLPKFTGSTTIGNSQVFDNGTNVGIGTDLPADLLNLDGGVIYPFIRISSTGNTTARYLKIGLTDALLHTINAFGPGTSINFLANNAERMRIFSDGNVLIQSGGTFTNAGFKLDVNGTGRFANGVNMATTSGNVGIGTDSPLYRLDVLEAGATTAANTFSMARITGSDSVANDLTLIGPNTSQVRIKFGDPEDATIGEIGYNHSNNSLRLNTNGAPRLTITSSGSLLVNTTGGDSASVVISNNVASTYGLSIYDIANSGWMQRFYSNTSVLSGSITRSGTTISFNTSSDYRLKEDLKQVNGLEKIKAINIYNYKWKSSQDRMDGVLAHELAEVLPYAVTGQKDGEQMQGVDYSKIVPLLIQSIKELKQEIDTLKL